MKNRILQFMLLSMIVFAACTEYKDLSDGLYADMETDKGKIILQLYPDDTPITVANFVALSEGTHPMVVDSLKGLFQMMKTQGLIQG